MSKCVVRMEMPKGCGSCTIANFGYCSINHKQVGDPLMGYPENRPANCPIICQLPEGHGRLVDADEAMEKLIHYGFRAIDMTVHECIEDEITTIVPAERSET